MDPRKRGRADTTNGGVAAGSKRTKEAAAFTSPGVGSKSKPCTKFFSTTGCPYGEGCHFSHYVPGGINVVAQMTNLSGHSVPTGVKNPSLSAAHANSPVPVKTKICNKYNTQEGCKYGDKCHFAHGEKELGRHLFGQDERPFGVPVGLSAADPAASFGASATAKISVDASLTGAIIGKGGMHSKQITRVTGARLSIKDHETDTNLKNIELEGTFDQIKHATALVRELIITVSATTANIPPASKNPTGKPFGGATRSNIKTKLCDNFAKGTCTFGDRCHFAHGETELRQTAV